jgi:hypothetical protein
MAVKARPDQRGTAVQDWPGAEDANFPDDGLEDLRVTTPEEPEG